ncbi:ABC transporter ATP-binding protein [Alsobacter soli]|uniref:ABC transporter ATP-binding protein n=1 Tax=Alsobacter soli TaxID=2109933 RepID=A0A2T1HLT3_9HYPH|nr:ABC transporter ATP-binding protein [Alsobacter soli]PSC02614.1 ABC transporter ATP-binding protein [Alsobacter soli]
MSEHWLIRAEGLTKSYPRRSGTAAALLGAILGRRTGEGYRALSDVDLELRPGEALGVIGRNGAGKSTLLQILAGSLQPTAGSIERRGRVAAMLALGAGFHPDFTGRENVLLSAAAYGLNEAEIAAKLPLVEAFADIGHFLDHPVRDYSSGMYARLAFAVCAHVDADVLIVDEILTVGDAAFQARCRAWMETFLERGALVFVSHDELAVLSVCTRALWLENGRQAAEGRPDEVVQAYRRAMARLDPVQPAPTRLERDAGIDFAADARRGRNPIQVTPFSAGAPSHGHGGASITDVAFVDAAGRRCPTIQGGGEVELRIRGRTEAAVGRPIVGFILRDAMGQNLMGDNTYLAHREEPRALAAGECFDAVFAFRMPYLPDGLYTLAPSIIEGTQRSHVHLCWLEDAVVLTVSGSPVELGAVGVPMVIEEPEPLEEDLARPRVTALP